ncbi:MAG: bifunctional riboflavin kinase/FAD synthetase [Microbacteriaceae bacterium]
MTWPVPADGVSSVVTVGKFDGVHRGHREVIGQLIARADGRRVVVVTFDRHPLSVVDPSRAPAPLLSTTQKVEQLEAAGADLVVVLPFTGAFRELSPEGFVRDILVDGLNAELVLVGEDFRYGRDGFGTIDSLRNEGASLGFDVAIIGDVCVDASSERISSSAIRSALSEGHVELAAHLLGRPHSVRGEVVHGHQRGRDLGFPTVNLEEHSEGFVPLPGVYAGMVEVGGVRYIAGISVGLNPTFNDVDRPQVEAHALDAEFDAYGQVATIAFTHRLRDSLQFSTIDDLMRAMDKDVADIRELVRAGEIRN